MLRRVLGVFVGMVVAFFVVTLVEALAARLYPLPAGIDPSDPAQLRDAMAHIPRGALYLVLAAWASGSFFGGMAAAKIGKSFLAAFFVGGLQLAGGVINMLLVPHPGIFWIVGPIALVVPAWLGGRLAARSSV